MHEPVEVLGGGSRQFPLPPGLQVHEGNGAALGRLPSSRLAEVDDDAFAEADRVRGAFTREVARLEQEIMNAIWTFMDAGHIFLAEDEDEDDQDDLQGPIALFSKLSAELTAGSKVVLLRHCLREDRLLEEFNDLPKRLMKILETRNVMAHSYGHTTFSQPVEGELPRLINVEEGQIAFWRYERRQQVGPTYVNVDEAFTEVAECVDMVSSAARRLDDVARSYAPITTLSERGLDLELKDEGLWSAQCRSCDSILGEEKDDREARRLWRWHVRSGACRTNHLD